VGGLITQLSINLARCKVIKLFVGKPDGITAKPNRMHKFRHVVQQHIEGEAVDFIPAFSAVYFRMYQ